MTITFFKAFGLVLTFQWRKQCLASQARKSLHRFISKHQVTNYSLKMMNTAPGRGQTQTAPAGAALHSRIHAKHVPPKVTGCTAPSTAFN